MIERVHIDTWPSCRQDSLHLFIGTSSSPNSKCVLQQSRYQIIKNVAYYTFQVTSEGSHITSLNNDNKIYIQLMVSSWALYMALD